MRLLIDANILLDVLQNREPYCEKSSLIWKLCETEQDEGYISALTLANLVYVMRKELEPSKIEDVLQKLALVFKFADLTADDLAKAAAFYYGARQVLLWLFSIILPDFCLKQL